MLIRISTQYKNLRYKADGGDGIQGSRGREYVTIGSVGGKKKERIDEKHVKRKNIHVTLLSLSVLRPSHLAWKIKTEKKEVLILP